MSNGELKLNKNEQRRLLGELLDGQVEPDVIDTAFVNQSQALWLSPERRSAYFREQRIRRLQRLDALRAQTFELELMPRVAAAESEYIEVSGRDFSLEIQALRADQRLSEDDAGWILTLELGHNLSGLLQMGDQIQLLDDHGRIWCKLPYRAEPTYIFSWQHRVSPIALLGSVSLHLQIL
jgi:hypothetical protein